MYYAKLQQKNKQKNEAYTRDKRIKIGTKFITPGDKQKRVRTVVDIYSTYNSKKQLVRVLYVSEHEFMGQKIRVEDVPASAIIRGLIKEQLTIKRPAQLFPPKKATTIAKQMQKKDPEWTYKVVHDPKKTGYSFIEIYDEDNVLIGHV